MIRPTVRLAGRRCRVVCAASGWQLGAGCRTAGDKVTCPRCGRTVKARTVRPGVVQVAAHHSARPVTCPACGTGHTDAVLHGFVLPDLTPGAGT